MKYNYLCVIFLFFSTSVFSAEVSSLIKKMQLAIDKNQNEQVEDIYDDNESTLSKEWMAQERLAISFERRNKFKEAADVYKNLIVKFNKDSNDKVVNLPKDKTMEDSFINSNKLAFYYYKMAFLNAQMFRSTNKYIPLEDRKKFLANTQGYLQLCKRVKVDANDISNIEEMIKEKIKFENELTFKSVWSFGAGLMSWQDEVILVNNGTNTKSDLLSTSMGTYINAQYRLENSRYEFNLESLIAFGLGSISPVNSSLVYQQSSVAVMNYMFGPGFYYKGISDKISLGLQFPLSYRTGDWQLPAGNYSFEKKSQFGGGYFLQIKYKLNNLNFQTRLGKIFPNPGSHWSIGGFYDF